MGAANGVKVSVVARSRGQGLVGEWRCWNFTSSLRSGCGACPHLGNAPGMAGQRQERASEGILPTTKLLLFWHSCHCHIVSLKPRTAQQKDRSGISKQVTSSKLFSGQSLGRRMSFYCIYVSNVGLYSERTHFDFKLAACPVIENSRQASPDVFLFVTCSSLCVRVMQGSPSEGRWDDKLTSACAIWWAVEYLIGKFKTCRSRSPVRILSSGNAGSASLQSYIILQTSLMEQSHPQFNGKLCFVTFSQNLS